MEFLVALVVIAALVFVYYNTIKRKTVKNEAPECPYKVEAVPSVTENVAPVVTEPAPAPVITPEPAPVKEEKPKKKTSKPKQPKTVAPKIKAPAKTPRAKKTK